MLKSYSTCINKRRKDKKILDLIIYSTKILYDLYDYYYYHYYNECKNESFVI